MPSLEALAIPARSSEDPPAPWWACCRPAPARDAAVEAGLRLLEGGRYEGAEEAFRRAAGPTRPMGHYYLGVMLCHRGRHAEGLAEMDRALTLGVADDDLPVVLKGRAAVLAWLGSADGRTTPFSPTLTWRGESPAGKTLLIVEGAQNGWGDTIQEMRCAPVLRACGARVVARCRRRLHRLLSSCEAVAALAAPDDPPPPFDWYVSTADLRHRMAVIPPAPAFLRPDPEAARRWRDRLPPCRAFRLGFNHHGAIYPYVFGRDAAHDMRAWPVAEAVALALPGVQLFSLLRAGGDGYSDLAGAGFPFTDLGPHLDNGPDGFVDTAAVLSLLDLFVTSDTAVAHLAGALGVPTWLLLSEWPEKRWEGCWQCPFYRSVSLFRVQEYGGWPGLFTALAGMLRAIVAAGPTSP